MIVMKFGGTSLKDAEMFKKSAEIVLNESREKIVVVSAAAGITDYLIKLSNEAIKGNLKFLGDLENLHCFYDDLLKDIFSPDSEEFKRLSEKIREYFKDEEAVLKSVSVIKVLPLQTLDTLLSLGEILSTVIFAALLRELEADSRPVPPARIRTDDNFGKAEINLDETKDNLSYLSGLTSIKYIPIISGFIGKTQDRRFTTLGRNGSDYTAAAIANIFDAEELQIWKDVDGVMRADPKIIPEAEPLQKISYNEAMEMTYFGSKVLDPRSIFPAIQKKIPIRIKNTYKPEAQGTLICTETSSSLSDVKVITTISDLALINVVGKGMLGVAGIAGRVFSATARASVNVMMISQASSEHSICFVVRKEEAEKATQAIKEEFELEIHRGLLEKVESGSDVSIIAIVGDGMAGKPGVAAKFANALARANVNISAIAQGSSERNISVLIESKDVKKAVRSVYNMFFKGDKKCEVKRSPPSHKALAEKKSTSD